MGSPPSGEERRGQGIGNGHFKNNVRSAGRERGVQGSGKGKEGADWLKEKNRKRKLCSNYG